MKVAPRRSGGVRGAEALPAGRLLRAGRGRADDVPPGTFSGAPDQRSLCLRLQGLRDSHRGGLGISPQVFRRFVSPLKGRQGRLQLGFHVRFWIFADRGEKRQRVNGL